MQEERKEASLIGRKEGQAEGRMDGRKDGREEGRREGRRERRKEGGKEGKNDGGTEGRKEGFYSQLCAIYFLRTSFISCERHLFPVGVLVLYTFMRCLTSFRIPRSNQVLSLTGHLVHFSCSQIQPVLSLTGHVVHSNRCCI